jgi:hypothetical protein
MQYFQQVSVWPGQPSWWDGVSDGHSYSDRQIRRAIKLTVRVASRNNKPEPVAFLPYIGLIFNDIIRMTSRHISSFGVLRESVKVEPGLKTLYPLRLPSDLRWTDRLFNRRPVEEAPFAYPAGTSGKFSRAEHMPTWVTASRQTTPNSDVRIISSGRRLRVSSSPVMWTGRLAPA